VKYEMIKGIQARNRFQIRNAYHLTRCSLNGLPDREKRSLHRLAERTSSGDICCAKSKAGSVDTSFPQEFQKDRVYLIRLFIMRDMSTIFDGMKLHIGYDGSQGVAVPERYRMVMFSPQ
jgi:hypothetical protein